MIKKLPRFNFTTEKILYILAIIMLTFTGCYLYFLITNLSNLVGQSQKTDRMTLNLKSYQSIVDKQNSSPNIKIEGPIGRNNPFLPY